MKNIMKNRDKYNRDMDMKIMEEKLFQAVNSGIKKCEEEERSLKMKKIKMGSIAAALVVFVGLGGCLMSPTFADTKIGKSIISFFDARDNVEKSTDLKYGGEVIASAEWEGKIMNITYGMRDKKGIVLFFELKNQDGTPYNVDPKNITSTITYLQDGECSIVSNYTESDVFMEDENKGFIKIMDIDSSVDFSELKNNLVFSGEMFGFDFESEQNGSEIDWFKFEYVEVDLDEIGCEEIAETIIDKTFDIAGAEVKVQNCQLGPVTSRINILSKLKEENKDNWFMPYVTVEDQDGNILNSGVLLSQVITDEGDTDGEYTDLYRHSVIGLENSFLTSDQKLSIKKISVEYTESPSELFVDINKGCVMDQWGEKEALDSPFYEIYDFVEKEDSYEFKVKSKGEEDVPLNENITAYTNKGNYTNVYGFEGAEIILENDEDFEEFNFGKVYRNYGSAKIKLDKDKLEEIDSNGIVCIIFKPVKKVCEVETDIKINSYK